MRWDRFFEDLEGQLDAEWEAERAALDTEAERLRLSRVTLRERVAAMAAQGRPEAVVAFELCDGTFCEGAVAAVGVDWAAVSEEGSRSHTRVIPLASVVSISVPRTVLLRSARPEASPRPLLSDRMTLGFVVRDAARRRLAITVHLSGRRTLGGTVDRAGVDHLDLALHEPGTPRRESAVVGYRMVPFAAIASLRLDDEGESLV